MHFLLQCILIHLDQSVEKFLLLTYMVRKLHAFARETCCEESNDRAMFQEVMLPGHLYLQLIVEKLEMALLQLRSMVLHRAKLGSNTKDSQASSLASKIGVIFHKYQVLHETYYSSLSGG